MNLTINRKEFIKSWRLVERIASTKSTMPALSNVRLISDDDGNITLSASNLKTTIKVPALGVTTDQCGGILLPTKTFGEMLKKIGINEFALAIKNNKATIKTDKSKMQFTTMPEDNYPNLISSDSSKYLCELDFSDFERAVMQGTICSTGSESDFPRYLGAALIEVKEGTLTVVATDGRRLSLGKALCDKLNNDSMLLPLAGLKEVLHVFNGVSGQIKILNEDRCAWFEMGQMQVSIRKVDASFPNYDKILVDGHKTSMSVKKEEIKKCIERSDIISSSHAGIIALKIQENDKAMIFARAPEVGISSETFDAVIQGEFLNVGTNSSYLLDGINACNLDQIVIKFNGETGQIRIDEGNFMYMLMPCRITEEDVKEE